MTIKIFLHKILLWAVVVLGICLLSGCFPGFNSRDEVMAYLKKKYPDQHIVLSSKYTTKRSLVRDWRIWSFTLSGYPKDTFQVASYIRSYPVPMLKTRRSIFDNFEKVVVLRRAREFEQGPLLDLDAPTRSIWRSFSSSEFWLRPAEWEVKTIDDIWRAKHLIDVFEQFLSEKKVKHEIYYYLRMYMQGPCYTLSQDESGVFMENLSVAEPGEKSHYYIEYEINKYVNRQVVCQKFYNSVMRYHQQMASQGNGVTNERFQAWAEEQLKLNACLSKVTTEKERDSLRKQLVIDDGDVRTVLIDIGQKPYMMATLSESKVRQNSHGIFFTYPQLRVFCLRSGLRVQGPGDHFTVTGVDGSRYEFSTAFYEEKKDVVGFEEDTCYHLRDGKKVKMLGFWSPDECVCDALIRRITGCDVRKMIVHEVKE
ncbi:hypothetical protein [Alloprevotella tannerae]|uniref:hypothetical protein n=1 Tax=Alloprevotella tannerae TaxID=76122 RepID=UPI0028EB7FFF|nr:hypothetical protein [Alloprevotella tannerae]